MEGFPEGKGRMEWASGVQFDGWFQTHSLLGRKRCSFVFADGAKWEGQLVRGNRLFTSEGSGLLTLPDRRQIQVHLPSHAHTRTHTHTHTLLSLVLSCPETP